MAQQGGARRPADAKLPYDAVEQAYAGYVYGDSTCGQRAVYEVGLTGIPVFNVNNNCSTGSTALMLGKQAVEGGIAECVLALGFEKMEKGALGSKYTDRENPLAKHARSCSTCRASARRRRRRRCSAAPGASTAGSTATKQETFAKVSEKARKHAANNPLRPLQPAADGRGGHGQRGGLRPAHPLPVLPAHVRRRGGDPLLGRLREEARHHEPRVDRGPGDDHRLRARASRRA